MSEPWQRIKLMITNPDTAVAVREELLKALAILEAPQFNRTDLHIIKHSIRSLPFKSISEDSDYIRVLRTIDEILAFVPKVPISKPVDIKLEA